MTPSELEAIRRIGYFDGLMGRVDPDLYCHLRTAEGKAYTEGHKRGRAVWRRPRRKRPTRTVEQEHG